MSTATTISRTAMTTALVVAVLASAPLVAVATPRVPQVVFATGPLQGYLNVMDGGINVAADQVDAQIFSTGYVGNTDFTLTLKTTPGATIGVYSWLSPAPTLFPLFTATAVDGYRALCHFDATGGLVVNTQDPLGNQIGTTSYSGIDRTHFGFYIQSPTGTFFSQDGRNGGMPQVLTYAGTGVNQGDWFICFEGAPYAAASSTFNGAVMVLQAVVPTFTRSSTWGAVKSLYR